MLARLPEGSREAYVTLTTDNGTQFTSTRWFIETLNRLGIKHRRTAYLITPRETATWSGSIAA